MDKIRLYTQFNMEKMLLLKPRQRFKNYKEMQEYLDAPFLIANSRNAQFREWSIYIKFSIRKSNPIDIIKVYDKPIKRKDGRSKGNHRKKIWMR